MQPVFIPWTMLWLLVLLWPISPVYAQSCDCEDATNCPSAIVPDTLYELCYDITDAFNDDLSDPAQGVCGVRLTFTHQHIWDLEMALVSPAGDTVQLVGPSLSYFGTTNSVLWDVLFLPCSATVNPDTVNGVPLSATWTNNQGWPFAGIIGGSYYPVGGDCLENFDVGPANGSWCLIIDNQGSFYPGQVLNFEVLLCDNSGMICCDADGGSLAPYSDVYACKGDSSLLLHIPPVYYGLEPDTAEYGYQYLIIDTAGLILASDSLPNLISYAAGTYTICGLSYRLSEGDSLYLLNSGISVDSLSSLLHGPAPPFCGDLSSSCLQVIIGDPPPLTVLNESLCQGDSIMVGDSLFYEAGTYQLSLQASTGCDSLVELHLELFFADTTALLFSLCPNDTLHIADTSFYSEGQYEILLENQHGCDSLLRVGLTYYISDTTYLVDTICQGDVYSIGDSLFSLSGNYTLVFSSLVTGCDSIVFLDLTVLDLQAQIAPPDTLTCVYSQLVLDASASSLGDGIFYAWLSPNGQFDGSTDSTLVTVTQAGTYIIRVQQGNCMSFDTVEVLAFQDLPLAEAGDSDTLNCVVQQLVLDGTSSAVGASIVYSWLSPNGNILSGENGLMPVVDAPAWYYLSVTDTLTGCVGVDSVLVAIDTVPPIADAGPDGLLTCVVDTVFLDGSGSYLPEGYTYYWLDEQGNELSWTGALQASVDEEGTYFLQVIDQATGCEAIDSVEVVSAMLPPLVDAGTADSLTCADVSVVLQAQAMAQHPLLYLWTTFTGNILTAADQAEIQVDASGWYFVEVTDSVTFCVAEDSVYVGVDTVFPQAEAGLPITLNCDIVSWELGEVFGTSQGSDFVYSWTDSSGNLLGNELHLLIDTGGTYVFTVLDSTNGCTSSDTVVIFQNQIYPVADAGFSDSLTCEHPQAILDGTASTQNPFMQYAWYNSSGQLVGTGLQVGVGMADTYCLVATNGQNFCADTSCVTIVADEALPLVTAGADQALDCETGQALLDASGSSVGPSYEFAWMGPAGSFLTDSTQLVVSVQQAGTYVLTITNTATSCMAYDTVEVFLDTAACMPIAIAGLDGLLNCYNPLYDTLDATATPLEFFWTWQWIALSGSVVSGEDDLMPVVTAGVYVLEVSNPVLGLSAYDTVEVFTDFELPFADAGPDMLLDCSDIQNPVVLDGSASSQGAQYIYLWSTLDGEILNGEDGLMPEVGAFGIYDLTVVDTTNGCSATDAMALELQGSVPAPCLPEILQIDCHDTTIVVADTCVGHDHYLYAWTAIDGQVLGATDEAAIVAYVPVGLGTFYLEVVDTTNACIAVDSVEVLAPNPCPPDCSASAEGVFNCLTDSVLLSGAGSSMGPGLLYEWEALSGDLCEPSTTLEACAASPGIYQLTVTDSGSGLSCVATVEVFADTLSPDFDLPANAFLDCSGEAVVLEPVLISDEDSLFYQWESSVGGCILGSGQDAVLQTNCVAYYYLSVTNQHNGCVSFDSVLVGYDTVSPLVVLNEPDLLTCINSSSLLSGAGSDFGPHLSWHWYQNGQLLPWAEGVSSWQASEPGIYCLEIVNEQNHCRDSVCVELLQQVDTPLVAFSDEWLLTCSDTSLLLMPDQPFNPDWSYQWYTQEGCFLSDASSHSVEVGCAGTYFLEVFDPQTFCVGVGQLEVLNQAMDLEVEAGLPDTLTCLVDQLALDGTASATGPSLVYSWLSPNGNILSGADGLTPVVDAPGWYYLELQDTLSGCTAVDSVQVFADTLPPSIDAGEDRALNCAVSAVQLEGSITGDGMYGFTWYGTTGQVINSDSLMPWVNQEGWYVLVVQDLENGCVEDDSVLVVLDTILPEAQIMASALVLSCATEEVVLDGSGSQPQGNVGFNWTTQGGHFIYGEQQAISAVDSAGWYILEVTDATNACTDTAMFYIGENFDEPQVHIAPPAQITCAQPEVVLDGSASSSGPGISYQWSSVPAGLPISGDTTTQAVVFQSGIYLLEILNEESGCVANGQVQVFENLVEPQAFAEALSHVDCMNPNALLSGENGSSQGANYGYFWYPLPGSLGEVVFGESQLIAEVDGAGLYVLEVTDEVNGCMARDTAEVLALQAPIVGVQWTLVPPLCPGFEDGALYIDSVLGGTEPYLYALNGADLAPYPGFNQLAAGTYSLLIEDLNGCTWDTTLQLVDPPQIGVVLTADTLVDWGEWVEVEAQLSGAVDTLWWEPLPPVPCNGCTSFTYQPEHNATYQLVVADSNGCTAVDEVVIYLRRTAEVYMANAFSPNADGINDLFYVQAGSGVEEVLLFQVYDRWGELLFEARHFAPNNPSYGWDGRFGERSMNPGVYVWQLNLQLLDGREVWLAGEVILVR